MRRACRPPDRTGAHVVTALARLFGLALAVYVGLIAGHALAPHVPEYVRICEVTR